MPGDMSFSLLCHCLTQVSHGTSSSSKSMKPLVHKPGPPHHVTFFLGAATLPLPSSSHPVTVAGTARPYCLSPRELFYPTALAGWITSALGTAGPTAQPPRLVATKIPQWLLPCTSGRARQGRAGCVWACGTPNHGTMRDCPYQPLLRLDVGVPQKNHFTVVHS